VERRGRDVAERTVACADVDAYGNVTRTSVDADLSTSGNESFEVSTFAPQTASYSCADCLLTRSVTDGSGRQLSYEHYVYDSAAHVRELLQKAATTASERLVSRWSFNANGTLNSITFGPSTPLFPTTETIRSFTYDAPYQLRLVHQALTQGTRSLVTELAYDDFGDQVLMTGPYLAGSAASRPQRGFRYDDLGRPTAVARQAISGLLVTDGVASFEYTDSGTSPSRVTSYSFAVPKTFSEGAIPQTSDVIQTSVFFDALGREIQTRERLGGSGTGDAAAHVIDDLGPTAFRVSHVVYDGAGRVTAAIEPFYAAGAGFVDYRTSGVTSLSPAPRHVRLLTYDARGRLTCEAYRLISSTGDAIPPPGPCVSDFTEGPSYTRATATIYRWTDGYLGVKVIPPENNDAPPAGRGPESLFDASGHLIATRDVDGNTTTYTYDALYRPTAITRRPSQAVSGRPTAVTSTLSYDLMGRIVERGDPNAGTRTVWYDAQGNVSRIQLPTYYVGTGMPRRDEIQIDYDMGRPSTTRTCVATSATEVSCTPDWSLSYDAPLDASFGNVAGRVAYAEKDGTRIQFGYSPEGAIARRAYTLAGVPGTFELGDTVLLDGRISTATLSSPAGSFSFENWFDSFRRLTRVASLAGAGTTYWRAPTPSGLGSMGAYDALGRTGAVDLDQTASGPSLVHATWQYKPYSGLEDAARVALGLTDLHWVAGMSYKGLKLTGFRDEVGKTTYSYWYNDAGQLRGSNAVPFDASPLSQNSFMCSSYTLTKSFGAGPSFGNLEFVREMRSPAFTDTYNYDLSTPPGPDAPTTLVTNSTSKPLIYDHGGRVTSKALGAESFEYNLLGQLVRVLRSGVQAEALVHDPSGLLLGRLSGNEVTYYLGDRATVTATALPGCTAPGCSVDPASVRVDMHLASASVRVQGGSLGRVLYSHRDRLGSVVATSIGGGVAGASYRYGPWGETRVAQGDSGDSRSERGFAGSIRLSGSLLVMGVRVYDSQLRQFLQPDPLDPMNYTYVNGDPVNRIDPTGMLPLSHPLI
jgi:RHS repeat-associated protein